MNYSKLRLGIILYCSIFLLQANGQNIISTISTEKAIDKDSIATKVTFENGEEIVFYARFSPPPPLRDSYADEKFCTLVFANEEKFLICSAYKDTISGEWLVDFPFFEMYKTNNSSSFFAVEYMDITIKDGNTLLIKYNIYGIEAMINKFYPDVIFPHVFECVFTTTGLVQLETNYSIKSSMWKGADSPRIDLR
ncbi:MAG: hypothetical protein DA408_14510 [Bacteroidetes bacterium]|nr:MAG: hypothetical protein C7N36_09980 [Bacteroidota bacterium]PTM11005.1 MAG: hypothetical protein DA408_14510 [Bacteroidota bacterium]